LVSFSINMPNLQDRATNRMVTLPVGQQVMVPLGMLPALNGGANPASNVLAQSTQVTCTN